MKALPFGGAFHFAAGASVKKYNHAEY